ncbi:MAG: 16S rRNA (cytosine(1402)-N(4))-methyltransferase RsmH [Bacteroidales bacterium]|nr:16S rRNA (cytosine(1402)-N(4))-methyltransferase RsmH [Bacteroidales bacterium]
MVYHIPALLDESVDGLNIRPGGVYVDATFGGGGHSAKILKSLGNGKLIAFDTDEDALRNVIDDKRLILLNQNFRFLKNNLRFLGLNHADGIIADLGVSFHQFDEPSRGFSFREDSVLDMRMSRNIPVTAADLLNSMDEEKLAGIFSTYGELPAARKIARSIVKARMTEPVNTTSALIGCVGHLIPQGHRSKYLARLYQALRIAVNDELGALKDLLLQSAEVLVKGGRLVIITYHSLEDRLVKNFMKAGNFTGEVNKDFYGKPVTVFRQVNRKVLTPGNDEIERNSRCRSARLRIAEKII